MARGTVTGEGIVSQASTDELREAHERIWGDKPVQRGRWVWDPEAQKLVRAEDYCPPSMARDAPIIADRIHEGTHFDDGERVVDIGSRRKRREFMRRTGVEDAADASPQWFEGKRKEKDRQVDRSTDAAFESAARKLYSQGKIRE